MTSHPRNPSPHSDWRILSGLVFAFAVLVFVEVVLLSTSEEQRRLTSWVDHTREVMLRIDTLVHALAEAENGRRGFIITGNDRYLAHFSNGVARTTATLAEIRRLTADNPSQLAACSEIEPLIHQRLSLSTNSILAHRSNNLSLDRDLQARALDEGQAAMERVRAVAQRMMDEERARLTQRRQSEEEKSRGAAAFSILLSLLGLTLFSTLAFLFLRAHRRRREAQAELQRLNAQLEDTVDARTTEIREALHRLQTAERKLQSQLHRHALLNQITRAIGERQDLQSILQVVVRSLEDHLAIDFACIGLADAEKVLTIMALGRKSQRLATELRLDEGARVMADQNGLGRCSQGLLVYEPDTTVLPAPFPQRLAREGLRSLVLAPLIVRQKVSGVVMAARLAPHAFESGDCEFLRQLSEHVALASHQAQLHQALQQAYDDLRASQLSVMQQERLRALGQMASGIAHDINNAISPISLYAENLLADPAALPQSARDQLLIIQRGIQDVAQTVNRMGEFYRQRPPEHTLRRIQINDLVPQAVELTQARWSDMPQRRGTCVEVQTELDPAAPEILGIASELREALINLIFNAVDAMPNGGTLRLRTHLADPNPEPPASQHALHRLHLEVIDSGAGMDDETRRRCLEPFFTTKGERGSGLGLAMVYGIAQRHDAPLEIESAPGQGTTVRLRFAPAPNDAPTSSSSAPQPIPIPPLRILVVDDDELVAGSLRAILERDGHRVVTALSGSEGIDTYLAALPSQPFAVVFTDLGMPYVDGRQVAAEVKTATPSIPVVLLTGWGQRMAADGDVLPNVDLVVSKPPSVRDLREALARCLSRGA